MLEEALLKSEIDKQAQNSEYDLLIIGAGPAGMSAALCAGRAKLKVIILEKALPGGETSTACIIDNYLGFPGGILGEDLSKKMEEHMNDYNIQYSCETVESIDLKNNQKIVTTDLGTSYQAKGIIIATGLEPKKLGASFEERFLGRGISYYAKGDAPFYKEKDVAVIGGGNCACYAADYLSNFVDKIYLIHHSDNIKAVKSLKEKVLNNPKINPLWNSSVQDAFGIDKLEKIKITNSLNNQHTWLDVKAMFVYSGRIPPRVKLHKNLETDEKGYIMTDECMRTNLSGIYAVGDIRSKQIRQIPTAVADGMIAAINVERDILR
jgi:thioredoxin reductase (NADPH)